jgi:hypothetical protein
MYMDELAQNDGPASKFWDISTSGTSTAITWVFMAIHVEETMDKRTTFTSMEERPNPCST